LVAQEHLQGKSARRIIIDDEHTIHRSIGRKSLGFDSAKETPPKSIAGMKSVPWLQGVDRQPNASA
jgi:hypothetical protein